MGTEANAHALDARASISSSSLSSLVVEEWEGVMPAGGTLPLLVAAESSLAIGVRGSAEAFAIGYPPMIYGCYGCNALAAIGWAGMALFSLNGHRGDRQLLRGLTKKLKKIPFILVEQHRTSICHGITRTGS